LSAIPSSWAGEHVHLEVMCSDADVPLAMSSARDRYLPRCLVSAYLMPRAGFLVCIRIGLDGDGYRRDRRRTLRPARTLEQTRRGSLRGSLVCILIPGDSAWSRRGSGRRARLTDSYQRTHDPISARPRCAVKSAAVARGVAIVRPRLRHSSGVRLSLRGCYGPSAVRRELIGRRTDTLLRLMYDLHGADEEE